MTAAVGQSFMERFIDRVDEQELFDRVVGCEDDTRLLTIRDGSGRGKSHLLEMLRFKCQWGPRPLPVSLVALDQLQQMTTYEFVSRVEEALRNYGLSFPTYTHYENERVSLHGTPVAELKAHTVHGTAAGVIVQDSATANFYGATVPKDLQERLRQWAAHGFVEDLRAHCETNRVVLLIDAYEKCSGELTQFLPALLRTYADADRRLKNLVMVIAGREVPPLQMMFAENYNRVVRAVDALSTWQREHVARFLELHLTSYEAGDVDYVLSRLHHDWTIAHAVNLTKLLAGSPG
jgi:hypothetical protein